MKNCTCIEYEDQGVIPDPDCKLHRKEEERDMGDHSGEKKSLREVWKSATEVPEGTNRFVWFLGLAIGLILVCAALVFVGAVLIALVRLFFWLIGWLVG